MEASINPQFLYEKVAPALCVPNDALVYDAVMPVLSGRCVFRYTVDADAYSLAVISISLLLALNSDTDSSVFSEYLPRSTVPFCAFVILTPSR